MEIHYVAHYAGAGLLVIYVTSDDLTATLEIYDHTRDVHIGTMPVAGGGWAAFVYAPYPAEVRVESNRGGSDISSVIQNP